YLISYPYGCAEQTSSKLAAMHYAKAFLTNDELIRNSKNFTLQGIKKLHNMQNYYGEFEYWEGVDTVSPYASLYTAQTLLEIAKTNDLVKESLKKKTVKMLNAVASENGTYQAEYSKFHQLYAAYILAENNLLSSSVANMLYEKKTYKGHFLATFYMAAILKATGKVEKAEALFTANNYELSKYAYKTYGNKSGNFESNVRDMTLHFIVKTKYFNKDANDLDVLQKEFSNLYSTQEKALALKAISTYLGKPTNTNMDVTVKVNNKSLNYKKSKLLTVDKVTSSSIELEPKNSKLSYSIELVKNLPKDLKNELSTQKELSIQQEFVNANGSQVDLANLKQGDKLFSKITIANYGKIEHVVLNQKVPACLSIVNDNIKGHEPHFKNVNINVAHKEIQDDRILHFINLNDKKEYSRTLKKDVSIENRGVLYSPLLATSIGECKLPSTIIEAMYNPRIKDHAQVAHSVTVKRLKDSSSNPKQDSTQTTFEEEAKALVQKIYQQEMNSNNPLEFANYFDFPLKVYFRDKNFSKEALLADKRKYFKDWSQRAYSNMKTSIKEYNKQEQEVKVKVTFDYKIYNGKKALTGESNHLLTVIQKKGKILVRSIELVKKN
ncbi:MAG: Alpha-2-macroglobulin, partial [uncultured Sulfurovum sp.]